MKAAVGTVVVMLCIVSTGAVPAGLYTGRHNHRLQIKEAEVCPLVHLHHSMSFLHL